MPDKEVTTKDGKKAFSADSGKFSGDAKARVDENEAKARDEQPKVARYYTEDGTPVEASTLPVEHTVGEPSPDLPDGIHGRMIPADQTDKRNEKDLDV